MGKIGDFKMSYDVDDIQKYWDSHLNLTQFINSPDVSVGSDEFYRILESSLDRYGYKDRVLKNFAKGSKGQRLLEVGCGLGLELAKLAQLGFHVTGVDLAPKAVELCNQYLKRKKLSGEAIVQNAEQLDFPDETFDAVYSSGVLQHTPNIQKAIDEIWRTLKPGSKILIILYHRHSWFYLLHKISGVNVEFESDDAPIINAYTRAELHRLFSKFKSIHIECEYYYPTPTRRKGALPFFFNRVFIPVARITPRALIKSFGWHLVLTAYK
jgi:ubiquinone/menaquinone biosynthesis C-methylase UbiE